MIDGFVLLTVQRQGPPVGLVFGVFLMIIMVINMIALGKRYKLCPKGKALVITGKTGSEKPLCLLNGAAFIFPMIQEYHYLDMTPFSSGIELPEVQTVDKVWYSVNVEFSAAVSDEQDSLQTAALRLISMHNDEVKKLAATLVRSQVAEVISCTPAEVMNDRAALIERIKKSSNEKLGEVGLNLLSLTVLSLDAES